MSYIVADFLAVCGEGTHSVGVFENEEILKSEYKNIKKLLTFCFYPCKDF